MSKRESEAYEIQAFCESRVYPLMRLLREGILHRTNIDGYKGIRQSGKILPNKGTFPFSYPQSKTNFGHSMGYICLFDFESAREEDYRANHHIWADFFSDGKPVTIVLKLNRQRLADKLIPNSARPKLGEPGYKPAIAFVEVWYPEAIPTSAIDSYIITWWNSKGVILHEFSNDNIEEFEGVICRMECQG
jgi:hypothetical protein